MGYLKKIIDRVNRNGEFYKEATPVPLLTLEEFFEGNDTVGSICCNVEVIPHPSEVETILKAIRARDDVLQVYVQITEMDDPGWPFSDTVWVITTAEEKDIRPYFPEILAPDEIWEGFLEGMIYEKVDVPITYKALACWWD